MNNGLKNTAPKGKIDVISTFLEQRLVITVSDTGSGKTGDQLKNLFSRFNTKLHGEENNTGIGLAITKSTADFHKIDISVDSEISEGTTFS